jgi:site-specific recombinase XerC
MSHLTEPAGPHGPVTSDARGWAWDVQRVIIAPGERWDEIPLARLRFRALVEVLLGTGPRISEVLSLDRRDVDSRSREVKIIGEGRKQRMLFFTDRALEWRGRYLSRRRDDEEPLFAPGRTPARRLGYDAMKNVPVADVDARTSEENARSGHELRDVPFASPAEGAGQTLLPNILVTR